MADPRVVKLAQVMVDFSAPVKAGDLVAIQGPTAAEPFLRELYAACLRKGAHPHLFVALPEQEELYFRLASDAQLDFVSPVDRLVVERFDCRIAVRAPVNTRALVAVPPERPARRGAATRELGEIFMRRQAAGEFMWGVVAYPTHSGAQEAEMSLHDYEDFVYSACKLDQPDPVAAWKALGVEQQRLIDWLTPRGDIHIVAPGTDLRLSTRGRLWVNCDGMNNFPDGEIFTAPLEDSVEGVISFTFPALRDGLEIDGVRLRFERGRVVEASATKHEAYLHRMLDMDEGARRLGEFAFGTNDGITRFTRNTLFDEKIGGTIHMALGSAYPETGGTNVSGIHWDMVCDLRPAGEVRVDGDLFLRDGRFVI